MTVVLTERNCDLLCHFKLKVKCQRHIAMPDKRHNIFTLAADADPTMNHIQRSKLSPALVKLRMNCVDNTIFDNFTRRARARLQGQTSRSRRQHVAFALHTEFKTGRSQTVQASRSDVHNLGQVICRSCVT